MKGDLANFTHKVKNVVINNVKKIPKFSPELEIALGPARVTLRAKREQNQKDNESIEKEDETVENDR